MNLSLKFILLYILGKAYCFNYITEMVFKSSEKCVLFFTYSGIFLPQYTHSLSEDKIIIILTFSLYIYFMASIRNLQVKEGSKKEEEEEKEGGTLKQ